MTFQVHSQKFLDYLKCCRLLSCSLKQEAQISSWAASVTSLSLSLLVELQDQQIVALCNTIWDTNSAMSSFWSGRNSWDMMCIDACIMRDQRRVSYIQHALWTLLVALCPAFLHHRQSRRARQALDSELGPIEAPKIHGPKVAPGRLLLTKTIVASFPRQGYALSWRGH